MNVPQKGNVPFNTRDQFIFGSVSKVVPVSGADAVGIAVEDQVFSHFFTTKDMEVFGECFDYDYE